MQSTPAKDLRCSLVMGTVDETYKLGHLLASLNAQTYRNFELVVVDQNSDKRVAPILAPYKKQFPILHIRSECEGLSKARNLGLQYVSGDIIAFPDDDCQYPPELLDTVAQFFISHPKIDCLSGRSIDQDGKFSMGRFDLEAGPVNRFNVWTRYIEYSFFLRRASAQGVRFDETLGVGAGTVWGAAEGADYLLELLNQGASLYYNPDVVVVHAPAVPPYDAKAIRRAYSYGCGMGRVLRKHRYPLWFRVKWLVRPSGGAGLSLIQLRLPEARYRWNMFKGRLRGLLDSRPL